MMILLGCSGALWITAWRARREGLDVNSVYGLAGWLFLGGVIGARMLFVLQHPGTIRAVTDLFQISEGGNVFYGCILGGLAGSLLYWWRRPFPFWPMADAVAPALAVGITLGRLGCFLHGCCFGEVTSLHWAVRFPAGSHAWTAQIERGVLAVAAPLSLPVHPTQLYAALSGLLILMILTCYFPHRRRDGEVLALLMILYAVTRWWVESLRADEPALLWGMTLSQNISIMLLLSGIFLWARLTRKPVGRFADLRKATGEERAARVNRERAPESRITCFERAGSGHRGA
jgi:phosphatidylglycerol:prolipoprotein diacylglycerol transferase